jgi:MFS family permease
MTTRLTVDRVLGLGCTIFGALVAIGARAIPNPDVDPLGPGWLPMGLGIGIALMGIMMAITSKGKDEVIKEEGEVMSLAVISFIAIIVYIFAAETIGYLVATLAYSIFSLWLLGSGSWRITIIVSVVLALALTLLFRNVMRIDLPYGLLW